MATRSSSDPLKNIRGANKEAAGRYLGELAQRQKAKRLLNPDDVSGDYDAGRLLSTTLGGELRTLTHGDLRVFRENVAALGKRFKGGVTAKSVIDLSLKEDRDRANADIRTAVPVQFLGGKIHFITNASKNSNVVRHHVHIELMNFSAAAVSPGKASDMVKTLVGGPLKFDCDCGRHTYWYRYIATVGRFNAGRNEPAFPKIRNPELRGIACKHVLRVMQQLSNPAIKLQIEKMIGLGRNNVVNKVQKLSRAQIDEIARQQRGQEGWKRTNIETIAEKRIRLAQARMVKAESTPGKPVSKATKRKIERATNSLAEAAQKLVELGQLTPKALQAILKNLSKKS